MAFLSSFYIVLLLMNIELFIARRHISKNHANLSKPVIKVAIISISIGIMAMILSISIAKGFQKEIQKKVEGFSSHIIINHFDSNTSFESEPVEKDSVLEEQILQLDNVKHIQEFAVKAGIIKTKDDIEGAVFKGVSNQYDWHFFRENMRRGSIPHFYGEKSSNEILISKKLADLLQIDTANDIRMYFIVNGKQRGRKFKVTGIYETGLEDFDKMFMIGDIRQIRKLNAWSDNEIGGWEIILNDSKHLQESTNEIYQMASYDMLVSNMKNLYPQIFDWLDLQDINVVVIVVLMVIVAAISIISVLLILILESTQMVGILKALGLSSKRIRKIFIYKVAYIIVVGLFWGNLIGIGFAYLQKYFHLIKLPQESYYVSEVPIDLNYFSILKINLLTLVICILVVIIPTFVINKLSPVKVLKMT